MERLFLHSLVLTRSQYFKTALSSDFKEGQSKEICLSDILPQHMVPLIKALYSDELPQETVLCIKTEDAFAMCVLCQRFLFPHVVSELVVNIFVNTLGYTTLSGIRHVELLDACQRSGLPETMSIPLLEALRRKLVWGRNVIPLLLCASECSLSVAYELCLNAVSFDLGKMKIEMQHLVMAPIGEGCDVRVLTEFQSISKTHTQIKAGADGHVLRIDEDGDAEIAFPSIGQTLWVARRDFCRLQAVKTLKTYKPELISGIERDLVQQVLTLAKTHYHFDPGVQSVLVDLESLIRTILKKRTSGRLRTCRGPAQVRR